MMIRNRESRDVSRIECVGHTIDVDWVRNGRALCRRWLAFGKCGCVSIRSVSESAKEDTSNESSGGDKSKRRTRVVRELYE